MSARLVELLDSDSDLDCALAAPDLGLAIAHVSHTYNIQG